MQVTEKRPRAHGELLTPAKPTASFTPELGAGDGFCESISSPLGSWVWQSDPVPSAALLGKGNTPCPQEPPSSAVQTRAPREEGQAGGLSGNLRLQDGPMFGNTVTLYLATLSTALPKKPYVLCSTKAATKPALFQTPRARSHSLLQHPPCAPSSHPSLTLTRDSSHKQPR